MPSCSDVHATQSFDATANAASQIRQFDNSDVKVSAPASLRSEPREFLALAPRRIMLPILSSIETMELT
jgi:hypothetical protein